MYILLPLCFRKGVSHKGIIYEGFTALFYFLNHALQDTTRQIFMCKNIPQLIPFYPRSAGNLV